MNKDSIVLDYGAGRGAWSEDSCTYRKEIRSLKGKVKKVYACDVDEVVVNDEGWDVNIIHSTIDYLEYRRESQNK